MLRIATVILPLAVLASEAQGQAPDPRANEAIQLFGTFCVATGGKPDRALAVLADGNPIATRLPDHVVQSNQGGQQGGVGWVVRSPSDGVMMLDYTAQGVCGLRIQEADEASMRTAYTALLNQIPPGTAVELPTEEREVNGVRTTYTAHSVMMGGHTAHLALTAAEQPIGEQQHLMTFAIVK